MKLADTAVPVAIVLILGAFFLLHWLSKYARQLKVKAQQTKACALLQREFVVVDLETTGLDPAKHVIIEIGAIRVTPDLVAERTKFAPTWQALVKIKGRVPVKITQITGITKEMLDRDGDELQVALAAFVEFVGDRRIVTYNAEFDMSFLQNALRTCGMAELQNPVSCALTMARTAFPNQKHYRLAGFSQMMGRSQSHRTISDAHAALIVYVSAVGTLGRI